MQPARGGTSWRRALSSDSLISRAVSRLAITSSTTSAQPAPISPCWPHTACQPTPKTTTRKSSSSSSSSNAQWKSRQNKDRYAREAKVQGLKSRAAFKLLEMDAKYRLFRRNQTVVDLGYAPGSWSQVALARTRPHGLVVGIDLIPAQPPRGVTSIQGDFLSPQVRALVKDVLAEQMLRRKRDEMDRRGMEMFAANIERAEVLGKGGGGGGGDDGGGGRGEESEEGKEDGTGPVVELNERPSYIDQEKRASQDIEAAVDGERDVGRIVDVSVAKEVVISDMSEPWSQTTGFSSRTLSNPYSRLMNTSGINFRDHAGSMDLCYAALTFASDTLKAKGHFICKFYQGAEDKLFQAKLRKMFEKVHREKPDSSRKDSKEAYFVALGRRGDITLAEIEGRR